MIIELKGDGVMNGILNYINEEPAVLKKVLDNRKDIFTGFVKKLLKESIDRIIIVGSGTSYHSGVAAKDFIEKMTGREVTVEYPYVFIDHANYYKGKAYVIGISQSGTSTSTIDALQKAKQLGYPTIAITGEDDSAILEFSEDDMIMPCGKELAGPKTKGYVVTVLMLYTLALELAVESQKFKHDNYDRYIKQIYQLVDNLPHVIEASLSWYDKNKQDMIKAQKISVVGYRQNYATAMEGALKLLECVRCPAAPYEFEEYLHGPYNAIDEDSYIILIKSPGEEETRSKLLYEIACEYTEHVYVISNENTDDDKWLNANFYNENCYTPLEYIVPIQVLAACIPPEIGIDPFIPKYPDFHRRMHSKIY